MTIYIVFDLQLGRTIASYTDKTTAEFVLDCMLEDGYDATIIIGRQ